MKLITIVGARPQFIKAAVVSRALSALSPRASGLSPVTEVLVHTGQHYDADMSDVFFEELDIPRPDYNLGIGGGSHGQNTGRMLEAIERVLLDEKPQRVLVYGDTDSTLAGALAAAKLHIPVAHVEAGLRSFNRRMPEEINRVLTDHIADQLYAPTPTAVKNLRHEGIPESRIHLVGDVMYDAALYYRDRARKPAWFDSLALVPGEFVLCTLHRAENTDDPARLRAIFTGLAESRRPILMPLHPRTRGRMQSLGITPASNIHLIKPVGYLEMVWLEANCNLVATDSGGVQKEAYFHGKPCVTLRDETEWVELVEAGWNRLAAADKNHILTAFAAADRSAENRVQLYGDGQAAEKVVVGLMCLADRIKRT